MPTHTPHRCEAATSRGTRCRKTATAYHPLGGGREALLCDHHQHQDREGRLRLPTRQPQAEPEDEDGGGPEADPIPLVTPIPADRTIRGLEYGPATSVEGHPAYPVRPAGTVGRYGLARVDPAMGDRLDSDLVGAIVEELVASGAPEPKRRRHLKRAVKRVQNQVADEASDKPGSLFTVLYLKEGQEHRTPRFRSRSRAERALTAIKGKGHQAIIYVD